MRGNRATREQAVLRAVREPARSHRRSQKQREIGRDDRRQAHRICLHAAAGAAERLRVVRRRSDRSSQIPGQAGGQVMIRAVIAGLLVVALPGCAIVPLYKAPANASYARVHLGEHNSSSSLWMCLNDKRYRLAQDSAGFAKIPSGQRVTIGVWFFNYVYNGVTTSCEAAS